MPAVGCDFDYNFYKPAIKTFSFLSFTMLMNMSNDDRGDVSLDKVRPAKKILKKVKTVQLPSLQKWEKYPRKSVIPFTINPADTSHPRSGKFWSKLNTNSKKSRIKKHFQSYHDVLLDYFICYEFSEKGRFHCHGMLYFDTLKRIDLYHFIETTRKKFGSNKNRKSCFKGDPFNSLKPEAFHKSYNYVTKDVHYIYKSRYKIKPTEKSTQTKIIENNELIDFFTNNLDPKHILQPSPLTKGLGSPLIIDKNI